MAAPQPGPTSSSQPRPGDSFIERFTAIVRGSPKRRVDLELRALDLLLSVLLLLLASPLIALISLALLATSGRPIRPRFFSELATDIPAYWQRLVVRPGLTGFAQMRRGYETSMEEKLAHDLEWIADRSVSLYLRTLAATALRVLWQSLRALVRA